MTRQRICKECNANEVQGVKFPKWGLLCQTCYNAREKQRYHKRAEIVKKQKKRYTKDNKAHISQRSAQYHKDHKEHINARDRKEYAEKTKDKPARPCIDCGAPMPPRAQKYCLDCKEKRRLLNVNQAMNRMRKKQKEE